jgi:hypothetical protein
VRPWSSLGNKVPVVLPSDQAPRALLELKISMSSDLATVREAMDVTEKRGRMVKIL